MIAMPNDEGARIDRRRFLAGCAGAVAAMGLPGCASLVTRSVTPVDGRVELQLSQHPELLERGGYLKVEPKGYPDEVYVVALEDGGYAALSPICTHLGCTVEIEGERLVCPCHGSTYSRSGTVLQGPAQEPLRRYPSRVTADGVLIITLRGTA